MSKKIIGIIPARYASTRFPGKPLALINGKPMIQRVYEQALKATSLEEVIVATDDERISNVVKDFGGNVIITAATHESGTERCAEVMEKLTSDFTSVINIQGDEPFIMPEQIEMLCSLLGKEEAQTATLVKRISKQDELFNSNVVKVVRAENGTALYFSRSPIPHQRGVSENYWAGNGLFYKHVGIYGYQRNVLSEIVKLPVNDLEKAESLEQLRWLANGYCIHTAITDLESTSIDTIEDLQRAEKFHSGK